MTEAGAGPTAIVTAALPAQPLASVAVTVIGKVPAIEVVPESRPPVESVMPVGRVPVSDQVGAPIAPVWLNCWL